MKMSDRLIERRKYIRLRTPVRLTYAISDKENIYHAVTKDISAEGLRFQTTSKDLNESDTLELKLELNGAQNPVHAKGKVIWKRKNSLEDSALYDVGLEFVEIEEDNKNTFLKFLCDLIYNLPKEGFE